MATRTANARGRLRNPTAARLLYAAHLELLHYARKGDISRGALQRLWTYNQVRWVEPGAESDELAFSLTVDGVQPGNHLIATLYLETLNISAPGEHITATWTEAF